MAVTREDMITYENIVAQLKDVMEEFAAIKDMAYKMDRFQTHAVGVGIDRDWDNVPDVIENWHTLRRQCQDAAVNLYDALEA